jgi:hypothetical protein
MHETAAPANASPMLNGRPDAVAILAPNASFQHAGAVSAAAANATPAPQPGDRTPDDDLAMDDAATRANASAKVTGHPANAHAVGEAAGADAASLPAMLVRPTAVKQSPIRLPPPASSRETGGAAPPTPRNSEPAGTPHAVLDPGDDPSVARSSDANGIDDAVQSFGHNEYAPPPPDTVPFAPGRIPVRPVMAAPSQAGEEALPWSSGSFAGTGRPHPRGSGTVTGRTSDAGVADPGGLPADDPMNAADRLREALSPIVRAARPAFDDDGIGLADDGPPATADRPQLRSTVNVNVAIGSAGTAAAWNAADPAVRESLRDALVEILRDDARRQGIDL